MSSLRIACAAMVIALAPASAARAYLDPARFSAPAIEGGAAGRYFTGAPDDGYTCSVCHRGGGEPRLALAGVPELWDPGATYELVLTLPEGARSAAANLEIAGGEADGELGTLELVPDAELEAADRCRDDRPATSVVALEGRLVARLEACGAARARVRWTAPATPRTDVRYFAAAVTANDSGDPTGDGAATLVAPLRARGAPEPTGARIAQRCTIGHGRAEAPWALIAALALLLAARGTKRRSRRAD